MKTRNRVYLQSGNIIFAKEPSAIKTILGSCVCVCLFDNTLEIGGMNHFLFPFWTGIGLKTPKYGDIAMERLFEEMIYYGCKTQNLSAKIFGGARIAIRSRHFNHPGELNIKAAIKFLEGVNIPVIAQDTGGFEGRIVIFHTDTGDVWVKKN